jgi:arabinan endo-1,5-alpha-L-arabinosidase
MESDLPSSIRSSRLAAAGMCQRRSLTMGRVVVRYRNPVHPGSFADPFVLTTGLAAGPTYAAFGTGRVVDGRVFEVLLSDDLVAWRSCGGALERLPLDAGSDYWAPEVVEHEGRWWLYYSVGHGDVGHTLRVAVAGSPVGPFRDAGVDLTPGERFAIDPNPFRDSDGTWYLYYARDDLDGERVGTMLAVDAMDSMTRLRGEPRTILRPSGDWQLFARSRSMYGATYDWHTLEGPCVLRRHDRYYCLYSGGSWETDGYAVAYAVADSPLGPWTEPSGARRLLRSVEGRVLGPGHNSVVRGPHGGDVAVYHAWDPQRTGRRMCIDPLVWSNGTPRVLGPSWQPTTLTRTG